MFSKIHHNCLIHENVQESHFVTFQSLCGDRLMALGDILNSVATSCLKPCPVNHLTLSWSHDVRMWTSWWRGLFQKTILMEARNHITAHVSHHPILRTWLIAQPLLLRRHQTVFSLLWSLSLFPVSVMRSTLTDVADDFTATHPTCKDLEREVFFCYTFSHEVAALKGMF